MSGNLRTAFFSALLVIAVAVPVFGLKLTTVGIRVEVHGAEIGTFWIIAACAVAMFVWQLFRTHLAAGWAASPSLPTVPAGAGRAALPATAGG
jgi:branched-chain amino acid transport system permease protein